MQASIGNPYFEIIQEQSYYPFGLQHNPNTLIGTANKYQYNGIEFADDLGLNWFDALYRDLDPTTGRWVEMDPKAEKLSAITPYNSMSNNPISLVEGDDNYKVNRAGYIKKVKVIIGSTTDRLIAVRGKKERISYNKRNGNLKNPSIEIKKGVLDNITPKSINVKEGKKTKKYEGYSLDFGKDKEGAKKTFEWLSNNTHVEWTKVSYTYSTEWNESIEQNNIYTSHMFGNEVIGNNEAKNVLVDLGRNLQSFSHIHNHTTSPIALPTPSDDDNKYAKSIFDKYSGFKNDKGRLINEIIEFKIYHNGQEYQY